MELSKTVAMEIVKEISQLLNKKLNIMNDKGYIIASSNPSRINTFHEGAYKIISENLSELEIQEKDLDLQGSYQGLNFPIQINDSIIGVVGITGNSDEIRAFGNIVKKMTEILIYGKVRDQEKYNKKKIREYFLIDWITKNDTVYNSSLIQRGLDLNIDIQKQRRIICFDISITNKDLLLQLENKVILQLYSFDETNLIFKQSNSLILATRELDKVKLNNQLDKILKIGTNNNAKIFIGVSKVVEEYYTIDNSYKNSKHALNIQASKNISGYSYYNDLNIELIYEQIPTSTKNQIVEKIFSKFTKESLKKAIIILKAYYNCNCSIKQAADLLNIHSNTLQYHLNKIKDKTKLDPRNVKDCVILQLCIDFYEQQNNPIY